MHIFTDESLPDGAMELILPAIRRFVIAAAGGQTASPARLRAPLDGGDLVFTVGGDAQRYGFRAYDTLGQGDDQLVALWERAQGRLKGLAIGARLGALRTGAIGALAADALAPKAGPIEVALIGCGAQAATLIAGLRVLRPLGLRVFCRNEGNRAAFAAAHGGTAMECAQSACAEADVILLATNASTPVIAPEWVPPGAHVSTLGPKLRGRHEMPLELAPRAALIATDSPAQIAAQERHMLRGAPELAQMAHLGEVLAGRARRPTGLSLFLSAGLAGSEVAALAALCA